MTIINLGLNQHEKKERKKREEGRLLDRVTPQPLKCPKFSGSQHVTLQLCHHFCRREL